MRTRGALLVALLTAACGWQPADEQALESFFEHSASYDSTRVGRVARVIFDPRVEGVVTRFDVTNRSDTTSDVGLRREATLAARVRSSGRERERTLVVILERDSSERWMVLGYRWAG